MRTYTHNMTAAHAALMGYGLPARKGYTVKTAAKAKGAWLTHVKNVALFFAAPFIGLVYLIAFPFVAMALLLWYAGKAVMANDTARPVAIAIAAPFIALAFVTVGPVVGLGALAWTGGKALLYG